MKKSIACVALLASLQNCVIAMAESVPIGIANDQRIKLVTYDPNNVVTLKSTFGYQTQIVFAPNEVVQRVSMGDSLAWQAIPEANNLFIKPMAASRTNMTVLTNSNSYSFHLDSHELNVAPTYKLQFIYTAGGYDAFGKSNALGVFDPDKMNWKYSFTGVRTFVPLQAFDNGQFTYFKFNTQGYHQIPAIFIVDKNRNETLVNYHRQGDFTVIHSVAKQFTFRQGDYVTSIYNDDAIGDWKSIR